jgi:hypothetical protein
VELKEFLTETIRQLITGVKEAQEFAESQGARVNPQEGLLDINNLPGLNRSRKTGLVVQIVEFDLAVTSGERIQTKDGSEIVIGQLEVMPAGQHDAENRAVSRIKFSLPVILPYQ